MDNMRSIPCRECVGLGVIVSAADSPWQVGKGRRCEVCWGEGRVAAKPEDVFEYWLAHYRASRASFHLYYRSNPPLSLNCHKAARAAIRMASRAWKTANPPKPEQHAGAAHTARAAA